MRTSSLLHHRIRRALCTLRPCDARVFHILLDRLMGDDDALLRFVEHLNDVAVQQLRRDLLSLARDLLARRMDQGDAPFSVFQKMGTTYLHLGRPRLALRWYRMARNRHPYPGASLDIANAFRQLGERKRALRWYRVYTTQHPSRWEGWFSIAHALEETGASEEAVKASRRAIRCLPQDFAQRQRILAILRRLNNHRSGGKVISSARQRATRRPRH